MKIVGIIHLSNHLTGCNAFETVKIIMNIKKGLLHTTSPKIINEDVSTQKILMFVNIAITNYRYLSQNIII